MPCLDAVLDITEIEQEELVAELLVFEILVVLPVSTDDVMALLLQTHGAERAVRHCLNTSWDWIWASVVAHVDDTP